MLASQVNLLIVGCSLFAATHAKLHSVGACITKRTTSQSGGTPWSVSYDTKQSYEILPASTKCACDLYKRRNTGDKQWDKCPDCHFDGTTCNSAGWHIGGDELAYYCKNYCNAQDGLGN